MLCERTGAIAHFSKYHECVGGQLAELSHRRVHAVDIGLHLRGPDRHADDQFPDGNFLSRLESTHGTMKVNRWNVSLFTFHIMLYMTFYTLRRRTPCVFVRV